MSARCKTVTDALSSVAETGIDADLLNKRYLIMDLGVGCLMQRNFY